MYKVTEVIDTPRTGTVADLPLDDYVEQVRTLPFLHRIEVARAVAGEDLPTADHCLVIEGWFDDVDAARGVTGLPQFPRLDELASTIHERAGIRRCFSVVEE